MKKSLFVTGLLAATITVFSCAENAIEPRMDAPEATGTRVGNNPKVMVYVETNDVNPLNAQTYVKAGNVPMIDILNIFAANINKSGNDPCIHFNQELANYMADVDQYIRPLQEKGIKVDLTLLPNHQGVGPANLEGDWNNTNSQVRKFARLVCWVVYHYGLDGVAIDDEYAQYGPSWVATSYSNLIHGLRAEFQRVFPDEHKLITVFDWGNTSDIDATAGAKIDYADHGYFSGFYTAWDIDGMTIDRWMPVAIKFDHNLNPNQVRTWAGQAKSGGYGGVMGFNMRNGGGNTTNYLNAIAQGFGAGTVTWNGVNYPEGPIVPGGHTITFADVPSNF